MFRVCPPYILFWRLKHLSDRHGWRARIGQGASRDSVRAKKASWQGAAAEQEDTVWGQRYSQLSDLVFLFSFQLLHRWSSGQSDRLPENTPARHTLRPDQENPEGERVQKVCRGQGAPCLQCLGSASPRSKGSWCGVGRESGCWALCSQPKRSQPSFRAWGETPGSTKPGPRVGCAAGFEGSGHRLQHSAGCASVLGHRLDAQGRSKPHAKPC